MRLLKGLLSLVLVLMLTQAAFARSSRGKHAAPSTPTLPPFPWTAIAEIVGPLLAIGAGAVIIRSMVAKEKPTSSVGTAEVASLPAAWFVAATDLFRRFWTNQISDSPHLASTIDYPGPASDNSPTPDL